jgi:tetratricopeptide (TPR) repeat protein
MTALLGRDEYTNKPDGAVGKNREYNKRQGLKAFRKRQWVRSISYLEKALTEKSDPQVLLFLGYASLFSNDLDGARRYFRGGLEVSENGLELLKGLAYVYLKDERVEDAINLWGEVLEKRPNDRQAQRALQRLRSAEDLKRFAEDARTRDFFSPQLPIFIKLRPYLLGLCITAGIAILVVIFYTTPLSKKVLSRFYPRIVELEEVDFPEGPVTEAEGGALYSFTEEEIAKAFVQVKKHIYRGRPNSAIILLNRIMNSNASPLVKERFEILYKFIDPPDPLAIDYNPHFHEIIKEPEVFIGVWVSWKGRVANLKKSGDSVHFDLLVNYEGQDTIEGIAHVDIDGIYRIENRQSVEVFGYYTGYDADTGKLLIQGMLLRDLGL